jgi:hypothetical protein
VKIILTFAAIANGGNPFLEKEHGFSIRTVI